MNDCLCDSITQGLLDSSSISAKCALAAVHRCLRKLWKSDKLDIAEELFSTSLQVASNSYWLVKVWN